MEKPHRSEKRLVLVKPVGNEQLQEENLEYGVGVGEALKSWDKRTATEGTLKLHYRTNATGRTDSERRARKKPTEIKFVPARLVQSRNGCHNLGVDKVHFAKRRSATSKSRSKQKNESKMI